MDLGAAPDNGSLIDCSVSCAGAAAVIQAKGIAHLYPIGPHSIRVKLAFQPRRITGGVFT
jgi:hypothetical protein